MKYKENVVTIDTVERERERERKLFSEIGFVCNAKQDRIKNEIGCSMKTRNVKKVFEDGLSFL